MNTHDIIEALDALSDPRKRCFLCNADLTIPGGTDEHVIPKWAQRRYDLWNQGLNLLNGTWIRYSQLTVPCCSPCNSTHLSSIEDSFAQTVDQGRSAVAALGSTTHFLWLGKIFYGMLYKELMLLRDRADPGAGTIITEDFLRQYRSHRLFLQQARGMLELREFEPGSVFVFEAQQISDRKHIWDVADFVNGLVIGIRVGRVALIGALGDGGAQLAADSELYDKYRDLPLHPLQFRELVARISYRSTLATRVPKYITGPMEGGPGLKTYQLPLGGLSNKPFFEPWIAADYAQLLSGYTPLPIEELMPAPGMVRSWMEDEHGAPLFLDYRTHSKW